MSNKNSDEHVQSIREIFQKQHERVVIDNVALERIRKLYSYGSKSAIAIDLDEE
jgi:hypothetical protein